MKPGETALTAEQLQLAFRQLRRPAWPTTLEEALLDVRCRPLIHGLARQMSRTKFNAGARPAPTPAGAPPVPPTPTQPPVRRMAGPLRTRPAPTQPDGKRLAANDRDD